MAPNMAPKKRKSIRRRPKKSNLPVVTELKTLQASLNKRVERMALLTDMRHRYCKDSLAENDVKHLDELQKRLESLSKNIDSSNNDFENTYNDIHELITKKCIMKSTGPEPREVKKETCDTFVCNFMKIARSSKRLAQLAFSLFLAAFERTKRAIQSANSAACKMFATYWKQLILITIIAVASYHNHPWILASIPQGLKERVIELQKAFITVLKSPSKVPKEVLAISADMTEYIGSSGVDLQMLLGKSATVPSGGTFIDISPKITQTQRLTEVSPSTATKTIISTFGGSIETLRTTASEKWITSGLAGKMSTAQQAVKNTGIFATKTWVNMLQSLTTKSIDFTVALEEAINTVEKKLPYKLDELHEASVYRLGEAEAGLQSFVDKSLELYLAVDKAEQRIVRGAVEIVRFLNDVYRYKINPPPLWLRDAVDRGPRRGPRGERIIIM